MELTEVKQQFIQLRAQGYSFDKIAQETGKSKQTLIDWSRELKEAVDNLKTMELEALLQSYKMSKIARLQTFGELLSRIREEALNRDLSTIPTEKLLELMLKYNSHLREEIVEPDECYNSTNEMDHKRRMRSYDNYLSD